MSAATFGPFLLSRLLFALLTVAAVVVLVYLLVGIAPASPTLVDARPLTLHEWVFGGNGSDGILRGDYGTSSVADRPAFERVELVLPATLELLGLGLVQSLIVGVPLGLVLVWLTRLPWLANGVVRPLYLLGASAPIMWVSLMLILIFAIEARAFPTSGRCSVRADECGSVFERLEYVTLPLRALLVVWGSAIALFTRDVLLKLKTDTVGQVASRFASQVLAALPILVSGLLSSLLIVETIFAWPGIGRLLMSATVQRDYPMIAAVIVPVVAWIVAVYVLCNVIYGLWVWGIGFQPEPIVVKRPRLLAANAISRQEPTSRLFHIVSIAAGVLLVLIVVACYASFALADNDPFTVDPANRLLPPGTENHAWGTDDLGRDQMARALHAGRFSLDFALNVALAAMIIGGIIGFVGGWLDGYFGRLINFLIDGAMTVATLLPVLIITLLAVTITEPRITVIGGVFAWMGWVYSALVVREWVRNWRYGEDWYKALASLFVHLLSANMAGFLLLEASVSFLGFGVQPPNPSWGNMLANSTQLMTRASYLLNAPGILLLLTVFCLNIIAERLRPATRKTADW